MLLSILKAFEVKPYFVNIYLVYLKYLVSGFGKLACRTGGLGSWGAITRPRHFSPQLPNPPVLQAMANQLDKTKQICANDQWMNEWSNVGVLLGYKRQCEWLHIKYYKKSGVSDNLPLNVSVSKTLFVRLMFSVR